MSIRNRIALYYAAATGVLVAAVFLVLYAVIYRTVYDHLDGDLDAESAEVLKSIVVLSDRIVFANEHEWLEREHGQIEVNPMFLQVSDSLGNVIRRSSNLRAQRLLVDLTGAARTYADRIFQGSAVRQLQLPILSPHGHLLGWLLVAMPEQEALVVLSNLRFVLFLAFPAVLLVVFLVSRFIAARAVGPINNVTVTAERITSENLDDRVPLPEMQDELHRLTSTINGLLDRLQDAMIRERQFTADASHELRTPLAALKGTLEVLIRRPRSVEHYEEKIRYCIAEVDRMSGLVENLLLLARHESAAATPTVEAFDLAACIGTVIARVEPIAGEKNIRIACSDMLEHPVHADRGMTEVILQNIITNAIKYSPGDSIVSVGCTANGEGTVCSISDSGIGITADQLARIFDRFYRSDESRSAAVSGSGLGLAIVKRLADLQHLHISVRSDHGTTFSIVFPS